MNIGYSTGSIAKGDFNLAIEILSSHDITAIELSALRENEIRTLITSLNQLNLSRYQYVSFHAPSKLELIEENELIDILQSVPEAWPIIVHPDIISNYKEWEVFSSQLCIENMDKRKPCGRTVRDLQFIFNQLPEATFCLDVAHARQVDPTMSQCYQMLKVFPERLVQIHLSDVTSDSNHVPLNMQAMDAYKRIIGNIPNNIPVILESPLFPGPHQQERIAKEIELARDLFYERAAFAQ
jgi:hypothetical protein